MRSTILIGTSHSFQVNCTPFADLLLSICREYSVRAIAEEWSDDCSTKKTVAATVCADLSLSHQFSDPTNAERETLRIMDCRQQSGCRSQLKWLRLPGVEDEEAERIIPLPGDCEEARRIVALLREEFAKREQEWLLRLLALDTWPAIFICGADHIGSFAGLLKTAEVDCIIAEGDWKPETIPHATRF